MKIFAIVSLEFAWNVAISFEGNQKENTFSISLESRQIQLQMSRGHCGKDNHVHDVNILDFIPRVILHELNISKLVREEFIGLYKFTIYINQQ